jgi:ABC-2 type transport system ATP-binding protein
MPATAILVTTHYLEEAEQCNRLGFMVAGELVTEGSPTEIKSKQAAICWNSWSTSRSARWIFSRAIPNDGGSRLFGDRLHVITDGDAATAEQDNRQKLEASGVRVIGVREGRFSLEDVFIGVVEKARREGKVAREE